MSPDTTSLPQGRLSALLETWVTQQCRACGLCHHCSTPRVSSVMPPSAWILGPAPSGDDVRADVPRVSPSKPTRHRAYPQEGGFHCQTPRTRCIWQVGEGSPAPTARRGTARHRAGAGALSYVTRPLLCLFSHNFLNLLGGWGKEPLFCFGCEVLDASLPGLRPSDPSDEDRSRED